jgi:hypothetical protein
MQQQALLDILNRLRRRVLLLDGTAGVVWGTVAAVGCLVGGAWLDLVLELPGSLRVSVLIVAAAAAAVIAYRRARGALIDGSPWRLAERLDAVSGSGGQILSGVDLAAGSEAVFHSRHPELSAGLARLAVERAVQIAASISTRAAAPPIAIRRSLATLGLVALAMVLFVGLLPRLAATEWRRFADPFGDHPPFAAVSFTVEPGDTKVIYGSGLEVHVTTGGPPVDGVELVLQPVGGDALRPAGKSGTDKASGELVVPMFPEPDAHWRASVANVTGPMKYFVRARSARSSKYAVEVITVPQIEDVQYHITPPAYTRQPAYDGPLPAGGLSGLPGTEVRLTVRSNRPLTGGTLVYISGDARRDFPLAKAGAAEDTVVAVFPITGNGRIEASIVDTAGQVSAEKVTAPVLQLPDERPFVRLMEPRAVSFATPTAAIPVVMSAEDDYGVSRLQLFRSLNDSRYLPADVPVPVPPSRVVYQTVPLYLAEYQLEPGDEIKLFARVEDNDPHATSFSGASSSTGKGAESTVALIRIISQEEFDRVRQTQDVMEMLTSKYQQAERRMESLAEEIERIQKELHDAPAGKESDAALREKLKELAENVQKEAEALRQLAKDRQPLAVDEEFSKELERLADALEKLQKKTQELAASENADRAAIEKQLEELANALREERAHLDSEVMDPLEKLAAVVPLARDEARFARLYLQQRDLADRMAALKGLDKKDDPDLKTRMRDLEDEQRQIRNELSVLLDDIEEHAARLPEDEEFEAMRKSASEFAAALRASGATEAMVEAEDGLAEFAGTRAHEGADRAAGILKQFLTEGGGAGEGGGRRSFCPSLGGALGQSLQQLMRNAGMGQSGNGAGGGGYSISMNTMNNVGMYGSNPNFNDSSSGGGPSKRPMRGGAGRAPSERRSEGAADAPGQATGHMRAAGGADAAIPLRYRRQVGRYFQRVADELGEK